MMVVMMMMMVVVVVMMMMQAILEWQLYIKAQRETMQAMVRAEREKEMDEQVR